MRLITEHRSFSTKNRLFLISAVLFLLGTASFSQAVFVGPTVVAKSSFIAQTTELLPTDIFTPPADGDFRVSVYIETPDTVLQPSVCAVIDWTDDTRRHLGGVQASAQPGPAINGNFGTETKVLRVKGNTAITVSVPNAAPSGCRVPVGGYSLFITVEELN